MSKEPITKQPMYDKPSATAIDPTLPLGAYLTLPPVYLPMTPVRNNRVAPQGFRQIHPRGICKFCKKGMVKPSCTVITLCAFLTFGPICIPFCLQDKCPICKKTGDLYCCCFC